MIQELEKQEDTIQMKGFQNKFNLQPDKFYQRVQELLKQKYKDLSELKFIQVNDYGIFLEYDSSIFRVNLFIDSITSPIEELKKEHQRFLQSLKLNNLDSLQSQQYFLPQNAQSDNFEFYILEMKDKQRMVLNRVEGMVKQDQKWKIEYSDLQNVWKKESKDELNIIYYAFKQAKQDFLQKDKLEIKLKYSLLSIEGVNLLFYCITKLSPFSSLTLRLNQIKFTNEISLCFTKQMGDLNFLSRLHLILHDNDVKDEQMWHIAQSAQKLTHLSNLKIDTWGNQVKSNGLYYVVNSAAQIKNLEKFKLKIYWNSEIDDFGTQYLKDVLPNFINLKYLLLNFYDNQITDGGCIFLAQGLKNMPHLHYLILYLVDNQITSSVAVQYLKNSIQKSRRLCSFILNY
ncbi:hypothetical protein TTHERM_000077019 (macronuclear) [Tetrahymena thermophila SB210]|uniref:Kinase domain protein n=1 Tax=Tetrahymena thermophila (strain SB210) TaxID=312017 RepID=W7XCX5_TETTS|nr:hypothetical protein TTHERM_000077019 [Tetrahymena thermophila SB210]EWS74438.1 hypothetical protein TTHERM_000077019 [Tetrahymena thermophila SB210]|eukprot:XP_012653015.1 hypothetical protein TTHERM_000077019 [Tetrahymena thermophila SB210]